nr:hypothetical protein BaRGS_029740 [Batillaria attramentaria]
MEGVDYDGVGAQDDASFPSELSEGTSESSPVMLTSVESASELFEESMQSPADSTDSAPQQEDFFDHPLSLTQSVKQVSSSDISNLENDLTAAANGYTDARDERYTKDAPELQLRRLGDLAFLFQMYEFSYNTYHAAKKDFNNDHAWLHFAGALDADLSSALFLEQAAHCFICMSLPMVRKYAFHMILAGHRFNKAGQDHIHFTIGRQSFNLKQLENATSAFKHLLTGESKQPMAQQGAFLREYLFVYKCFTNSTDNKLNPVTFVGVSIQVSVENPLQVVLVLSDITLLWTFLPSITGGDPAQLISNEVTSSVKNHLADEIIQTDVIKEVVLNGNQTQPIVLSLVPRQAGELRVVGLAYNLGTSSLAQNAPLTMAAMAADSTSSSKGSASSKPSYISSICVRGKQRLEVQGPRLNVSKEEKTGKVYGPDRRLDLVVQEEMPILNVAFCDFPEALLCGEVHCVEVEFSNTGTVPLRNLRVSASNPHFFTFGCGPETELPKYPYTYQMRGGEIQQSRTVSIDDRQAFLNLPQVTCIPCPGDGVLHPGQTVSLPVWLRGNDIGGVHEVDFLFYYEPVTARTQVKYRVARHKAVVNMVESLSVRALAMRQTGSVLRSAGQELNTCYVFCELENLSQVQVQRPHIQELQISQVSCASDAWTIANLSTNTLKGIRIGSRETLQLMLKGTGRHDAKGW